MSSPSSRTTSPQTSGIRRPPPPSASPTPRGAARAASPRVTATLNSAAANARRPISKPASPPAQTNGVAQETREALTASLKQETDEKENLLVQVQNKDLTITELTTENTNITSALNAAETRLNELYADQNRMEEEMATRIELSEKIRAQVRELEKEKRDVQRRYNEQTASFEAERQAFYDNEQHLKSRIQSLTQTRKQLDPPTSAKEYESEAETDNEDETPAPAAPEQTQDMNDPDNEPAEMTSLRLELSTLSTSYASIQSTLVLLQTQLVDLKRVNNELQEENESYLILLRERTLSGQFDIMKHAGNTSDDEDDDDDKASSDHRSLSSMGRPTLDPVHEMEEESHEQELERSLREFEDNELSDSPTSYSGHRQNRKRSSSPGQGESLADLPITGPGLDLAAELGRAENKDILDGNVIESNDRSVLNGKAGKKGKKDAKKGEGEVGSNDLDALRTEVKSLKDANKALSLYASKIIDRIISQEGFEHVLAVDYDKEPKTPSASTFSNGPPPTTKLPRARPQSLMVNRSTPGDTLSNFRFGGNGPQTATANSFNITPAPAPTQVAATKANRRSFSLDWKTFSIFGGSSDTKAENPNLRPLTLRPGLAVTNTQPVPSARKIETVEDEGDRRERERLAATMKLMGIQPNTPDSPGLKTATPQSYTPPSIPSTPSRFSFFRRASTSDSSSISSSSAQGLGISGLTTEALAQAEAEESLAALDAHEKSLSAEMAKGATGGFTEIPPRAGQGGGIGSRSRRSKRTSGSGSGSTVWSMGKEGEEDDV